ncbi:hypothetical protein [Thermoflavifilum thermophilum]|uniref:Uncharacterized protein n=1 Tax=Thermoflavifilum thermophilum TaxID=1393122 RepID=A0A1I7N3R6_9BACT|nr:hypothetical protein [Thermoflavifilum thermophilum]SFV29301.1 hypothetical protein SAMN05660895_0524 [Thermoflavifilum thermophilum]
MKRNSTHCQSGRILSVAFSALLLFFGGPVLAQQSHLIRGQVFESNGRTPLL